MKNNYKNKVFNPFIWLLAIAVNLVSWSNISAQTCTTVLATQNFETGSTTMPSGWTSLLTSGSGAQWQNATASSYVYVGTGGVMTSKSGTQAAWFNGYAYNTGNNAALVSPAFSLSSRAASDSVTVSFWMYRHNAYTGYTGSPITVYVNTTNSLSGATAISTAVPCYTTSAPTVPAVGWYLMRYNIPASYVGATNYVLINCASDYWNDILIDDISIVRYNTTQTYAGSRAFQLTNSGASAGIPNQQILTLGIATTAYDTAGLSVTQFDFNTANTLNVSGITAAKLYYTGATKTFSTTNLFGTATSPSGAFTITGTRSLKDLAGLCVGDTAWFWLTYDLASTATDTVNASWTSAVVGGTTVTPSVSMPGRGRLVANPLSGAYTIGGSGSRNYTSFAAAFSDLTNLGVSGPVTFTVAAGTYTGQLIVPQTMLNVSATNNVVFDGVNPATRIITSSTSGGATLLLNKCKYVTFRNFTIANTVSGAGTAVAIVSTTTGYEGTGCQLIGNIINLPNVGTNTSYAISITSTANGHGQATFSADSIIIDSNTINGGYYGISAYNCCTASSLYVRGMKIRGNTINNVYYMGMYLYYIYNAIDVLNNTVTMLSTSTSSYGIYYYYNQNSSSIPTQIIGNKVYNGYYYGMYVYYPVASASTTLKMYNNLVTNLTTATTSAYPVYVYMGTGITEIYHNTFVQNAAASSNTYSALYYSGTTTNVNIKNNVLANRNTSSSGLPLYLGVNPVGNTINYNIYHNAAGSNLVYRGSLYTTSTYRTSSAGGDSSYYSTANPFVSSTNFNLVNGCIGKGVNMPNIPLDLAGNTRNTLPDPGAYEFTGGTANDLAVDALLTPVAPVTLGTQDLVFRVRNVGNATIYNFNASYKLNTNAPVVQPWFGTLNTCDTTSVTFTGSNQITLVASNAIKVYTDGPNSSTDPNRSNDTISVTYLAPLSGNFTINPALPSSSTNFRSFGEADTALQAGIVGPVYITVAPGTYTGQINIRGGVVGASATNNIVFDGVSAASCTLTSSTSGGTTVLLNKCKYVTFRNFTIANTVSGNGTAIAIVSTTTGYEGTGCAIKNNIINLPNVSSNTSYGINITGTANGYGQSTFSADSVLIDSNTINGGYYGINAYNCCTASPLYVRGLKIRGNTINNAYYMGMYIYYNYNAIDVLNNTVTMSTASTSGYGIYFYYNQNSGTTPTQIIGNKISNGYTAGLYVYYPISGSGTLRMYNNVVLNSRSTTGYGAYLYMGTGTTEVFNNTFVQDAATTSNTYAALYYSGTTSNVNIKNNILANRNASGSGLALYCGVNPSGNTINYNTYMNAANTNLIYRGTTYTAANYNTTTAGGDSSFYKTTSPFVSTTNLAITNGCGGKGVTNPNITTDILGTVRNSPPDIGAYEFAGGASNDIAVDAITSPVFPVAAGSTYVTARVRNVGVNPVYSFDLAYTVNGGTAVSTTWFGTLNACDTVSVSIPTPFTVVNNVQYSLKVFTANPNSSTDPNRGNDTMSTNAATPLNGTYTIGATASDYTSFAAANAALQLRGVSGPVTFNVKSGIYNESVNLVAAPGLSATNTVTFTSLANNADSVKLVWNSTSGNNYVLGFTGNYYKVNKITIMQSGTTVTAYGVNVAGYASYDTLSNCKVMTPYYYLYFYTTAALYANNVSGTGMAYVNNSFTGSYYGVYYYGVSTARPSRTYFAGNTFDSSYYSPFYYLYYTNYTKFDNNTFKLSSPTASTTGYSYWYYNDSAYTFTNNRTIYASGITSYWYNYYRANTTVARGLVANNSISTAGTMYMYWGNATTSNIDFYQNSFNMGGGYFYISNSGLTDIRLRNNIFSGSGSYSLYWTSLPSTATATSNYNLITSTGSSSPIYAGTTYSLDGFRAAAAGFERNSISYRAAFTSTANNNLVPNPADTAVWAINGRGIHLAEVTTDKNNAVRPATIVDGAPDLGAYEVTPTAVPPMAVATPATPAAGTTQLFTFGNDTVASITWDAFTTPPTSIAVRQYSGKQPVNTGAGTPGLMYFYTDISVPTGTYLYDVKIFYKNSWFGTMFSNNAFFAKTDLKLAKKNASSSWAVGLDYASVVDTTRCILSGSGYTNFSQFTGFDNSNPLPVKITQFNGSLNANDAKLKWTTASELNANQFVVERSVDGSKFVEAGKVKAAGNSTSLVSYDFVDRGAALLAKQSASIFYRLRTVDNDGSYEYSKTIELRADGSINEEVVVAPNPFTNNLSININAANSGAGKAELMDLNGKVLGTQDLNVDKGTNSITVQNAEQLKQGIYLLRVITNNGTQVFRIVKN